MANHVSLKAMAEDKSIDSVGKVTHFKVDPRIIKIEQGFNVRSKLYGQMTPTRRAYIDSLKQAKLAGAVFPPLDVRVEDGDVILVDGENRLLMDLELIDAGHEILFVECRHFRGSDAERVAHMVSTGQQGLQLTPLESGHGYRRLANWGWPVQRIAAHARRSDTHVEQCIMLAESDTAIQEMLVLEQTSADVVIPLLRKHGSKKTLEILIDGLERERANGGKKVTAKSLYGPVIPRQVVSKVVSSLDTFYTRLSESDRENLQTLLNGNEAELEGKTVTMSAASLKALFDAHQEVQQVYAKSEKREQNKRARAASSAADGDAKDGDDEFSLDDVVTQHKTQAAA
ncbi:TPA: hypothetical protein QDA90_005892 [Burkholderia vietnamiensis]|uniref:hypothetical protein n=1 Tax=Burkholderia vietnamiensis TaxID=60552 RepID=UPI00298A0F8A|nr:hypothetical protein [Burkholderia vietnamiensis]